MGAAHTSGPWAVLVERGDDHFVIPSWDDESAICRLNGNGAFVAANAHLIAAAPDLLEALQGLEPYLDAIVCYASTQGEHEPNRLAVAARAAISRALPGGEGK